jgi:pimeloyl-ACP methyl ester carboxylesterase
MRIREGRRSANAKGIRMSVRYATNLGNRIAYEVYGRGPVAVVLQHAFLRNRGIWKELGYVDPLAEDFTVVAIDSLAHGESGSPREASRYLRKARAGDVAAVLDAEKIARAHYVGYSMGAWLGIGMLAHRPERILSLTLGAFDPDPNGMTPPAFETFFAMAARMVPDAVAWVTPERKPALAVCFDAIAVRDIPAEVVLRSTLPLHLWTGAEDTTHEPFRKLQAQISGATLSVVPGNHATAMSADESVPAVREFLLNQPR